MVIIIIVFIIISYTKNYNNYDYNTYSTNHNNNNNSYYNDHYYNNDYYKKIVRNVVKGQLSEGSTLLINWEGEYRPRHMKALFDILSLHE